MMDAMYALALALLLSQTPTSVKVVDPVQPSKTVGTTDANGKTGLNVAVTDKVKVGKNATAPAATAVTVTTTPTALPSSILTGRVSVCFMNTGNVTVYIGPAGVDSTTGFPVAASAGWCDDVGTQAYFGVTAVGTTTVRVLEN